ncbi:DUF418 domain-containing protein [Xanthomonas fragariae]|uniref:Transporter n=2 Tax=Xanthomonas fragariae TaxID=48664 RepID=A0A1Y6HK56_9XANT|nr:DUF418 domain-containing protein [Xanthomonas fragariae]AOD15390.1 hypothetical protein BER92_12440 [Xanthomonas fragariae]AOD18797.1 hypothetical protein BER93_12465 [Xanthomonas fragariae]ENZ93557.1 transporter [Xanthomonas fragariae LMG 25863]MBL9196472.1 DUF418 domain-containing protein [Xanthomonas fragariae]MBL9221637.1 DUF418 domain-containing protein [Xanthomonas fragariae]
MTQRDLLPIATTERIFVLDVLRGFALLGILLMNIEAFVGPLDLASTGVEPHWHGADRIADALVYVLVQGKFHTLFSLLFGMGFAVMAQRAEQAGRAFFGMYLRRTAGLLVIGLAHALLIWSGDILVAYALLALLLLTARTVPTVTLPWFAALVYLCAPGLILLYGAAQTVTQADPAYAVEWKAAMADAAQQAVANVQAQRAAFGSGTYLQATLQRWHDLREAMTGLGINGPAMLGMFVLGSWFVRSGAIATPERFPRLFATLRYGVLPLGLGAMLVSLALEPWIDPARLDLRLSGAFALSLIAGPLMSLGYAAWVVRLAPYLAWLAPAGRMALSNYLLQSLLCTWIFYGYGLGYFEQLSRVWQLPFALALFALQAVLSQLWLRWFHFGPMEWLWRSVTYLHLPPMWRGSARVG